MNSANMTEATLEAACTQAELTPDDLDHADWERAQAVPLTRYWSGDEAARARHAEARLLWSNAALHARFVCCQAEPLIVSAAPQFDRKTLGLWERDVCELFIAPDAAKPEHYFEFEVAPTGEWLDLAVALAPNGTRATDWEFRSGMTAAARVEGKQLTLGLRVPWAAFALDAPPRVGAMWRANLYRCVGAGAARGYLAWRPTLTPQPNFHVPARFGWLCFVR